MRNLKKVLALVMALAMVMTMFAGAISFDPIEFVDADSIQTDAGKDASAVLSALGIFVGDNLVDPAINGTAVVTREEMAKVAFLLKTGNGDISFYNSAAAAFSDNNSWGRDYVAYAALNGILAGDGNGSVRPTDGVTGVEAAKIMLTVLGYDATTYGLVGSNWKSNTITLASNIGILNGVTGSMELGLSRENVMIMAKNTLYTNVKGGATLLKTAFNMTEITAVAVANNKAGLQMKWNADAASEYIATDYTGSLAKYLDTNNDNLTVFAYRDYVVTNAANNAGYFTYKAIVANEATSFADLGTEYRLLVEGLDNVVYNSYDIRDVIVIGESASQTFKTGKADTAIPTNTGVAVYLNKNLVAASAVAKINTTAPWIAKDNNQDGTYDFIWAAKYSLGIVTGVTEDGKYSISYTNTDLVTGKKSVIETAFVETNGAANIGDYVVTWADLDANYIKKLDVVTGYVSGLDSSGNFAINGTTYKLADESIRTTSLTKFLDDKQWTLANTEYTFIADGTYLVAVATNTNTKYEDYAIVIDASWNDDHYSNALIMPNIKLFTADNQYHVYTVASVNGYLLNTYNGGLTGNYNNILDALSYGDIVSYVVDGASVHLQTADVVNNTNTGSQYWDWGILSNVKYDSSIDMWICNDAYLWDTNGATIFATDGNEADPKWVAYAKGDFYTNAAVVKANATAAITFETAYTNTVIVKVMAVELAATDLPGTVLGAGGSIVISNGMKSWSYDNATKLYTYVVNTVAPRGGSAGTVTFQTYFPVNASHDLDKGYIYKINTDANGIAINVEKVEAAAMSEYVHINGDITSFYLDAFGKTTMIIGNTPIVLANDATIYTVADLETSDYAAYTYEDLISAYYAAYNNGGVGAPKVNVYAIYNAAGEVSTAIINVDVK